MHFAFITLQDSECTYQYPRFKVPLKWNDEFPFEKKTENAYLTRNRSSVVKCSRFTSVILRNLDIDKYSLNPCIVTKTQHGKTTTRILCFTCHTWHKHWKVNLQTFPIFSHRMYKPSGKAFLTFSTFQSYYPAEIHHITQSYCGGWLRPLKQFRNCS